jgi:hypothetical protein
MIQGCIKDFENRPQYTRAFRKTTIDQYTCVAVRTVDASHTAAMPNEHDTANTSHAEENIK